MSRITTVLSAKAVSTRQLALGYLVLVKPFIVLMVLISALCGMYIGQKALPDGWLMVWTLIGIGLSSAGAAALNNYVDRDIDSVMARTKKRPLPAGAVNPAGALVLGVTASVLSMVVMISFVNPMAMFLNTAAIFIYVVPYTMLTKRRTPLATFVGGVGGALPPVIGYAAVKPEMDIQAFILFFIIFAWQHPHFWSLALKYKDEYAMAGVNNLPVAKGVDATKRSIAIWAAILAPVSVLPYFTGMAGQLYLVSSVVMGAVFLLMSLKFLFSEEKVAMRLFFFSIVHLPFLYCMMVVDMI